MSGDLPTQSVTRVKRCLRRHPNGIQCSMHEGHEGDHVVKMAIHPKVEEFLQSKGQAFNWLWRKKLKKGLNEADEKALRVLVDEFHATEEP